MDTKTLKTPPKISVRIWEPVVAKFDKKVEAACLRRDAYLTRVLECELPWLDSEVSIANSSEAQAYIAGRLDTLERKLVSFTLPAELITRINEVCQRKRIVRDAFFNRLYLLLAVGSKVVDRLLFGVCADEWRGRVWSEHRNDGPFFQNSFNPLEQDIDPFWAMRTGLELYREGTQEVPDQVTGGTLFVRRDALHGGIRPVDGIYTVPFGKEFKDVDLTGMNCYLPDWEVPGTVAQAEAAKTLDEILSLDM